MAGTSNAQIMDAVQTLGKNFATFSGDVREHIGAQLQINAAHKEALTSVTEVIEGNGKDGLKTDFRVIKEQVKGIWHEIQNIKKVEWALLTLLLGSIATFIIRSLT